MDKDKGKTKKKITENPHLGMTTLHLLVYVIS